MSKDTSAAVLLAVELVEDSDSGLFLAMPCEYVVGEQSEFFRAIDDAACAAQRDGLIVAFGTTPSYADTNLGYMRAGAALADRTGFQTQNFCRKTRPQRSGAAGAGKNAYSGIPECSCLIVKPCSVNFKPSCLRLMVASIERFAPVIGVELSSTLTQQPFQTYPRYRSTTPSWKELNGQQS